MAPCVENGLVIEDLRDICANSFGALPQDRDYAGQPDDEWAEEALENYRANNDSVIAFHFQVLRLIHWPPASLRRAQQSLHCQHVSCLVGIARLLQGFCRTAA